MKLQILWNWFSGVQGNNISIKFKKQIRFRFNVLYNDFKWMTDDTSSNISKAFEEGVKPCLKKQTHNWDSPKSLSEIWKTHFPNKTLGSKLR
jgi:hypothetical protein